MSNSTLHKTIRQVIDKHGQDIISDLKLMYILSDYGAFDKLSDEHDIVKDLQANGFGQLVLDCKRKNDSSWQSIIDGFVTDFLSNHNNYDSAEVIYICDSITYGAGLLPENTIRKKGGPLPPSTSGNYIDYSAELRKLKEDYLALLKSSIILPKGKLFKKPSGYFPFDAQNVLYLLEHKIQMLGKELKEDLSVWCATEKQKVLDESYHPIGPQRYGLLATIAIPTVVVITLIVSMISYIGSKDAIDSFNKSIANADSLYQAKDYVAALSEYEAARISYDSPFRKSMYQNKALSRIKDSSNSLVDDVINTVQPFYKEGKFYEAQNALNSLPEGIDTYLDDSNKKRLANFKSDLDSTCEMMLASEINDFIKNISQNKGKPSKDVMDRIDYLLTIFPSNYWLNFIKNKSSKK